MIHLSVKFRVKIFHPKCYFIYEDGTLCDVDLKMSNVQHYKIESDYQETAVDLNKHFTGKIMILSGSLSCFLQLTFANNFAFSSLVSAKFLISNNNLKVWLLLLSDNEFKSIPQ